jgi:hypothetical protein
MVFAAELDRRDRVTATNSWPNFPSRDGRRSIIRWQHLRKRVHSTCTKRQSLNNECGSKGGDRGGLAHRGLFEKRDNKEEEGKK